MIGAKAVKAVALFILPINSNNCDAINSPNLNSL